MPWIPVRSVLFTTGASWLVIMHVFVASVCLAKHRDEASRIITGTSACEDVNTQRNVPNDGSAVARKVKVRALGKYLLLHGLQVS